MSGFKIKVKGVVYDLHPYKELRNEWDLVVDGKMVVDSRPYYQCLDTFLTMVMD